VRVVGGRHVRHRPAGATAAAAGSGRALLSLSMRRECCCVAGSPASGC
jgi:hypothetical protein